MNTTVSVNGNLQSVSNNPRAQFYQLKTQFEQGTEHELSPATVARLAQHVSYEASLSGDKELEGEISNWLDTFKNSTVDYILNVEQAFKEMRRLVKSCILSPVYASKLQYELVGLSQGTCTSARTSALGEKIKRWNPWRSWQKVTAAA